MAEYKTHSFLYRLGFRWLISSLGLWVAASLFSGSISVSNGFSGILVAGFILAIINSIIKPIVVILSMPAILFSLGLFVIVINGLMVMLVSVLYEPLSVSSLWMAMLAGMVIGLVHYLVTTITEETK